MGIFEKNFYIKICYRKSKVNIKSKNKYSYKIINYGINYNFKIIRRNYVFYE